MEEMVLYKSDNGNTPIIFELKENVKAIEYDLLRETQSLSNYDGKLPKNRPIEHFELIERLCNDITSFNLTPVIDPIFVSSSDSKRILALDPNRAGIAKSWLFQRLVTRIGIKELMNSEFNASIGVGYNTFGINLAWGLNVRVCQNMSILGAMCYMSTYGNKREPGIAAMTERFREWLRIGSQKFDADVNMMESMKQKSIDCRHAVPQFIGELQMAAVKKAYLEPATCAPLNIGQMSEFSKKFLTMDLEIKKGNEIPLFDLYNIGTNVLKPRNTDIVDIWKNNAEYSEFFINAFNLN